MKAIIVLIALSSALLGTAAPTSHQAKAPVTVQKFPLKHVAAEAAYEKLKQSKLTGIDYLTYDPTDNSIVARGDQKGLDSLKSLLAKIDLPQLSARVFVVQYALAQAIKGKLKPIPGMDQIAVDSHTNSLVAKGTESALDQLAKAIADLDRP